jgi:hypothetical protein
LSRSDPPGREALFDQWIAREYRRTGGFTALIVLIEIGELTVAPLKSTYAHVIGDDIDWAQLTGLLSGAGVAWDGVLIEALSAPSGGPVPDGDARAALRALERRIAEDRLAINRGHFFDRWGRRMKVEEAQPQ